MPLTVDYGPGDALLVVDMQNDSCAGGALAVAEVRDALRSAGVEVRGEVSA